jgi:glycosyltransferase involved in cell wall biosynthesis
VPFFSVIIPTYNRAHTLSVCLDSLLNQLFNDFEIILIDDGSTDRSADFIRSNYGTSNIKYFYQDNQGVCAARNNGIKQATGQYICFLDSDDYVISDWLNNFHNILSNNNLIDVVFCNALLKNADESEKVLNANYPYRPNKKNDNGIYLAGLFTIRHELLNKIGLFDEYLKFGEFTDLGFRINKFKPVTAFTGKVSLHYIISPEGGGKNLQNKIASNIYFIKKHQDYFKNNPKVHQLFLQNIGVAYLKLNDFKNARIFILNAWTKNIFNVKVFLRFLSTYFPLLYKKNL